MGKIRGFLLRHRVNTIFRSVFRRHSLPMRYHRLDPHPFYRANAISRLISWTHNLRSKAKDICCASSKNLVQGRAMSRGCMQTGQEPLGAKPQPVEVPKGHMAIYVGQTGGDFQRVLVPVIYFNHPLFGQLLREAEEEFGYNHPGAITIPCRISEFEHVQTRIKQGRSTRKLLTWKRQA
ncbi:auxin-responsive protein SAUR36-like [Coffea eugenioides]|uniref:auxin-responsive protein SAUR36-like n=1 Tax=Coffea eugenioides TaxID=49369 RepID=UPI000F60D64A|nr:auxin-responsive protein SAUR36-like [Coffea eugenioides]